MTKIGLNGPLINIFIDNIKIIAPKNYGIIQCVKVERTSAFSIVDMRPISFYLSLKI